LGPESGVFGEQPRRFKIEMKLVWIFIPGKYDDAHVGLVVVSLYVQAKFRVRSY
jgi:hypothetical protein